MMQKFTDSTGRVWEFTINVTALKRVKAMLPGVDLAELTEGDPPLITRLSQDIVLVGDVLYVLCLDACHAGGISDEEFGKRLGGDAMFDGMDALLQELTDFFRQRPHLVKMIQKQRETVRAAIRAAEVRIDQVDPDQVVAQAFGT